MAIVAIPVGTKSVRRKPVKHLHLVLYQPNLLKQSAVSSREFRWENSCRCGGFGNRRRSNTGRVGPHDCLHKSDAIIGTLKRLAFRQSVFVLGADFGELHNRLRVAGQLSGPPTHPEYRCTRTLIRLQTGRGLDQLEGLVRRHNKANKWKWSLEIRRLRRPQIGLLGEEKAACAPFLHLELVDRICPFVFIFQNYSDLILNAPWLFVQKFPEFRRMATNRAIPK
jgi:hypothetical protein